MVVAVRFKETGQARQRITIVPVRPLGAHQIAASAVDVEGWIEHHTAGFLGLQIVHPLRPAGFVDLVPDLGDAAKTLLLVVEVVIGRRVLHAAAVQEAFKMPIEMRDAAQAGRSRIAGIEFSDVGLGQVGDRAQAQLLCLGNGGAVDLRRLVTPVEELDTIDAGARCPAHPFARLFGRRHPPTLPAGVGAATKCLINIETRGNDLARRRPLALVKGAHHVAAEEGHAAHRRHPVRQPQSPRVAGVVHLVGVAVVAVHVHKAGQDIHAGGVDLARRVLRRAARLHRQARRAGGANIRDFSAIYDDVSRAVGRPAIAGDDGRAADHQRFIRPRGQRGVARRRWLHLGICGAGQQAQRDGDQRFHALPPSWPPA